MTEGAPPTATDSSRRRPSSSGTIEKEKRDEEGKGAPCEACEGIQRNRREVATFSPINVKTIYLPIKEGIESP